MNGGVDNMSVKSCEKIEKSQVALTIEVGAEAFQAAVEKAYRKMRGKINMPGFRPGKAPRKLIERMYGVEVFFEEAINIAFPDAYEEAVKEQELQVVGYPEVELLHEPKTFPWLQRGVRVYDPDGHLIEVSESMFSVACRLFQQGKSVQETAELIQHPLHVVEAWHEKYQSGVH